MPAEVIRLDALVDCMSRIDPNVSEYLLLYMYDPQHINVAFCLLELEDLSSFTLTVDTSEDLNRTRQILSYYPPEDLYGIKLKDIVSIIRSYPIPYYLFDANAQ